MYHHYRTWLVELASARKGRFTETWVMLTNITGKAKLTKKTMQRRLKNLKLLQSSPDEFEGRLYAFGIQYWCLQKILWRTGNPWGTARRVMEAGAKRRAGFHLKEQHLDPHCLAAGQECHPVRGGIELEPGSAKTYSLLQGASCPKGRRPGGQYWLWRDTRPTHTVRWAPFHFRKVYIFVFLHHAYICICFLNRDIDAQLYGQWDTKC